MFHLKILHILLKKKNLLPAEFKIKKVLGISLSLIPPALCHLAIDSGSLIC